MKTVSYGDFAVAGRAAGYTVDLVVHATGRPLLPKKGPCAPGK